MELISGNQIAATIVAELKTEVAKLEGRAPCLALVRVGDDPASISYVKKKEKTAAEIGVTSRIILPSETITQTELETLIDDLNADPEVDGILVQSPLPGDLDELAIFRRVSPDKDVDGFHTLNLGKIAQEDDTGFASCTPAGIMEMLARSDVDLRGKPRRRSWPLVNRWQTDRTSGPAKESRSQRHRDDLSFCNPRSPCYHPLGRCLDRSHRSPSFRDQGYDQNPERWSSMWGSTEFQTKPANPAPVWSAMSTSMRSLL